MHYIIHLSTNFFKNLILGASVKIFQKHAGVGWRRVRGSDLRKILRPFVRSCATSLAISSYLLTLYSLPESWWLVANKERTICKSKLLNISCVNDDIFPQRRVQGFTFRSTIFGLKNWTTSVDCQKSTTALPRGPSRHLWCVRSLREQAILAFVLVKTIAWVCGTMMLTCFICSWPFSRSEPMITRSHAWQRCFCVDIH